MDLSDTDAFLNPLGERDSTEMISGDELLSFRNLLARH